MATLFSCVAASSQPCAIAPKRSKGTSPEVPDVGRVLTVRHLPDTNPDRFLEPAGVLFSSERRSRHPAPPHCLDALDDAWEFAPRRKLPPPRMLFCLILLVLALSLPAGCALSIPPSALPSEVTPELPARTDAGELCRPPDVDAEILQAAWAYVHEHYPMQPWPNDVYTWSGTGLPAPRARSSPYTLCCAVIDGIRVGREGGVAPGLCVLPGQYSGDS